MEEQKQEKYFRADVQGGYLFNKSEIDYYKQSQVIDVMDNLMLGDYNSKGGYVLSKGIIDELVKMKKVYQYSFGSTTFCQSSSDIGKYGKIDFAVKVRNSQDGMVTSTLQLLETIDRANGYYQNTNTASIAEYKAKESNTYIVDMLKYFNIISKKEDGLLHKEGREDEELDMIIARKQFEELLKLNCMGLIDAENKALFEKRMKILAKSAVGKKILEEFEKETTKIAGWFVKEDMPGFYRYLNQMMDGLIEMHSVEVLQDPALKAGLNKANDMYAENMHKHLENARHKGVFETEVIAKAEDLNKVKPEEVKKAEEPVKEVKPKAEPEKEKGKELAKPAKEEKKEEQQEKQKKDDFKNKLFKHEQDMEEFNSETLEA